MTNSPHFSRSFQDGLVTPDRPATIAGLTANAATAASIPGGLSTILAAHRLAVAGRHHDLPTNLFQKDA